MNERKVTVPELILLAVTRAALGFGVGLLVSRALNNDQRKAAGIALTVIGGITTVPIAMNFLRQRGSVERLGPSVAA